MKRFTFNASGHTVEFVCTHRNTRNGFAHDARVIIDGHWYGAWKASAYYLNRTWEAYNYQSVMFKLCRAFIDEHVTSARTAFMHTLGYKRMTKQRKTEFCEYLDQYAGDPLLMWINVYEQINNHGIRKPPYPGWYTTRPKTFVPSYFA